MACARVHRRTIATRKRKHNILYTYLKTRYRPRCFSCSSSTHVGVHFPYLWLHKNDHIRGTHHGVLYTCMKKIILNKKIIDVWERWYIVLWCVDRSRSVISVEVNRKRRTLLIQILFARPIFSDYFSACSPQRLWDRDMRRGKHSRPVKVSVEHWTLLY